MGATMRLSDPLFGIVLLVVSPATALAENPVYSVGGLQLGARFGTEVYKKYECTPSEQFEGFTWCVLKKQERESRGSFTASYSVLHSSDGTARYINRFQEPAFWDDDEVNDDIARYSRKIGQEPRRINLPSKPGFPEGVIAVWGTVSLEKLDNPSRAILAADKSVRRGVLVDFIGNYTRSAREGLPLYRLTGGAGFVWVASNKNGRGTLRFLAIDPSTFYDDPMTAMAVDTKQAFTLCHSGDATERLIGCSSIINGKGFGSKVDLATALDARCWAHNDLQQYERGLADCNASIALHPKYSYAYANLGNSFIGLGRAADAITAYTKAIELKPDKVFPLIARGHAFLAVENKEAARKDFDRALIIEPGNQEATQALAAMDGSAMSGPNPRVTVEEANARPPVEQASPRPTVEQANPRPTVVQDAPIPSRWDSLAQFLQFFRFF